MNKACKKLTADERKRIREARGILREVLRGDGDTDQKMILYILKTGCSHEHVVESVAFVSKEIPPRKNRKGEKWREAYFNAFNNCVRMFETPETERWDFMDGLLLMVHPRWVRTPKRGPHRMPTLL